MPRRNSFVSLYVLFEDVVSAWRSKASYHAKLGTDSGNVVKKYLNMSKYLKLLISPPPIQIINMLK